MSKIKLQKGVPLPETAVRLKRDPKYPFKEMEVQDSFFLEGANANTVHSAITRYTRSVDGKDKKFMLRTVEEPKEEGSDEKVVGIRVWRTA